LIEVHNVKIYEFIKKVHSYGSKILIDDFGTGYSNFSYLVDLNVDIIKIDASITKEIVKNPKKLHILKTIHNFTEGLNMLNVAEFVETKEIALLLQEIGVEYAQGYFFCKPAPKPLENSDMKSKLYDE
jgi:EAL domain-containing protein (putative c-di-GMP-specific phosphodiesterase class I)